MHVGRRHRPELVILERTVDITVHVKTLRAGIAVRYPFADRQFQDAVIVDVTPARTLRPAIRQRQSDLLREVPGAVIDEHDGLSGGHRHGDIHVAVVVEVGGGDGHAVNRGQFGIPGGSFVHEAARPVVDVKEIGPDALCNVEIEQAVTVYVDRGRAAGHDGGVRERARVGVGDAGRGRHVRKRHAVADALRGCARRRYQE